MASTPGRVRLDDLIRVCSSSGRINHDLLQEMLQLFIDENERRIRAVLMAADNGDSSRLRCETHAMKGSAAIVGAEHLRDLAADVEVRILTGTIRDPQASARRLRDEFAAVVATLRGLYPGLCPH